MGVTEIRQEIAKRELSIKTQQQTFEDQRQQIVEAIKPFVREKIKSEVENHVRTNAEHTKELGKAALSEMKKRLTDLIANSDRIVDETFSDDSFWVYVNYKILPNGDRFGQGYNNTKAAKENILKGIKIIIGEAGKEAYPEELRKRDTQRRENGEEYCRNRPECRKESEGGGKGNLPLCQETQ